jgi:NAD(P)-dependent dehydrogenase (short-subunit alcohol dehydrogenase family)
MSGRVQDKVVIITGGASGIGEGMVRRFCADGARVVLADVDQESGIRVSRECGARFVAHDVSSESSWEALAQTMSSEYGRLDVLLNNAGIVSNQSIVDVDVETWNRLMSINLTGMMLGCRTAIALMRENPEASGGSIVNTASSTSYLAIPSDVAYTTSKAGVVGLTKSVAVYCATEGLNIRVNSIHPGATLTNILRKALEDTPGMEHKLNRMSPMGRLGKVEEVAAMALFLASDEASFCTGGQFPVEGGTVSEHPRMF